MDVIVCYGECVVLSVLSLGVTVCCGGGGVLLGFGEWCKSLNYTRLNKTQYKSLSLSILALLCVNLVVLLCSPPVVLVEVSPVLLVVEDGDALGMLVCVDSWKCMEEVFLIYIWTWMFVCCVALPAR